MIFKFTDFTVCSDVIVDYSARKKECIINKGFYDSLSKEQKLILIDQITQRGAIFSNCDDFIVLHASSLMIGRKTFIFLDDERAVGKSTVVYGLSLQGGVVLQDEFLHLDHKNRSLHFANRSFLTLKPENIFEKRDIVQQLGGDYIPPQLLKDCVLIFLRNTEGVSQKPRIKPTPESEKINSIFCCAKGHIARLNGTIKDRVRYGNHRYILPSEKKQDEIFKRNTRDSCEVLRAVPALNLHIPRCGNDRFQNELIFKEVYKLLSDRTEAQ